MPDHRVRDVLRWLQPSREKRQRTGPSHILPRAKPDQIEKAASHQQEERSCQRHLLDMQRGDDVGVRVHRYKRSSRWCHHRHAEHRASIVLQSVGDLRKGLNRGPLRPWLPSLTPTFCRHHRIDVSRSCNLAVRRLLPQPERGSGRRTQCRRRRGEASLGRRRRRPS